MTYVFKKIETYDSYDLLRITENSRPILCYVYPTEVRFLFQKQHFSLEVAQSISEELIPTILANCGSRLARGIIGREQTIQEDDASIYVDYKFKF